MNLNEIGQIKRHEKAEIKGYPSAFSEFKIGISEYRNIQAEAKSGCTGCTGVEKCESGYWPVSLGPPLFFFKEVISRQSKPALQVFC